MPNPLVEPLYERLLRSFPADQSYARADLGEAMPEPVRHYLTHLLRHHGQREARRLRRARTNWVGYDHPEMEQVVRTFFAALEDHTQVPQDEWADTLRTAVRRTTDHLVRPVPVLTSFVFEEADAPVPVSQVQWRMRFFGSYSYLREAVQAYVKKRGLEAFEADAFEQVLRRVDEHMTADFDAEQWLRLLESLFDVAQRATGHNQVPLSLLKSFFDEKNASRIVERLRTYEQDEGADAIAPNTLRPLIEALAQEDESPRPTPQERPSASSAEPSPEADLSGVADAVPAPGPEASSETKDTQGATPLWQRFQHGRPRRHGGRDDGDTDRDSQPLWTRFQRGQSGTSTPDGSSASSARPEASSTREETGASSKQKERGLASLEHEVLGTGHPSHRDVYVEKLFQGDKAAYRRVLERLRNTEKWSEASQIIAADVFRAHQVNIYSDAAVHFTNAVEAAFKNKK